MKNATIISGGTLIDCTGKKPVERSAILVEGNRIKKIGTDADVKAYAKQQALTCTTIDATGMTMMPGMIDSHVHCSYGDVTSAEELNIYTSAEYRTLRAANNVRKVLRAGVTSMCDPGGTYNVAIAIRDGIRSGLIEGPRMVAAGQYISTLNGIGSVFPTWMEHPIGSFSVIRNTRDEMITEIRKQVRDGVDIIKVSGDGDTLRSTDSMLGSFTHDDLKAIADMTHLLGKRCTIHARGDQAAYGAALAGFDWLIHCSYISDKTLDVVGEKKIPLNPTISLLANGLEWGPDLGLSKPIVDGFTRELEAAAKNLSKAYKAGVMILAGTDTGQSSVPYGEWHAREMEHLMNYLGMSAMDALMTGTRNGAFAMGMSDVGTIEEGKLADILVVDGNPLADISVLQDKSRLKVIMMDGVVVDRSKPLPVPTLYRWEKPQRIWVDPRLATQEFVREHATNKPRWMRKVKHAA